MKYLIASSENFSPAESNCSDFNFAYYCAHCGAELMGVFNYTARKETFGINNDGKRQLAEFNLRIEKNPQKIKMLKKKIAEDKRNYKEWVKTQDNARKAYKEAEKLTLCPICGGELYKKTGYFMPCSQLNDKYNDFFCLSKDEMSFWTLCSRSVDEKLERMKSFRDKIELDEVQKRVEKFLSDNDLPVEIKADSSIQVYDTPEKLKDYIMTLLHLENNIYSLSRLLSELYYLELNCKRNIVLETNEPFYLLNTELNVLKKIYTKALEELEKADSYKPKVSIKYPVEPTAPRLAEPGFFNKKKVLAENERLIQKYQADMKAYRQEVMLCDEKKADMIEKKRADFIKTAKEKANLQKAEMDKAASCLESAKRDMNDKIVPSQAAKELIGAEIIEIRNLLKNTLNARNELYSHNVIFKKYRNAVALASFYEYLMSGRCSSLTGADGAYNIYENEIRLNQIVTKLDDVISSLEEIKKTQYLIYSELQAINSTLSGLSSTMDKALTSVQNIEVTTTTLSEHMAHISQNTDVIAHNTAVTAYYSKVNADLTNALGYMVALG